MNWVWRRTSLFFSRPVGRLVLELAVVGLDLQVVAVVVVVEAAADLLLVVAVHEVRGVDVP